MASPIFSSGKEFKPDATFEQMNAPVTAEQLQQQYDAPAATPQQMGRMTYEGTVTKTAVIAIGTGMAAVPGYLFPSTAGMWVGSLAAFVLSMVIIFQKRSNPVLIAFYAVAQGYALGAITTYIETVFEAPGAGRIASRAAAFSRSAARSAFASSGQSNSYGSSAGVMLGRSSVMASDGRRRSR